MFRKGSVIIFFAAFLSLTVLRDARAQSNKETFTSDTSDLSTGAFLLISPENFDNAVRILEDDYVGETIAAMAIDTAENRLAVMIWQSPNDALVSRKAISSEKARSLASLASGRMVKPSSWIVRKETPPAAKVNSDGRVYFIAHTTLKSLPLYLWAVNAAFDNVDPRVNAGIGLLSTGAGLYGSYQFTRNMSLGYGKVALMNYGGELGFLYPLFLSWALRHGAGIDESAIETRVACAPDNHFCDTFEVENDPAPSERIRAWGSMIGFPLGIYLGSKARIIENANYGNAAIARDLSRAGILYGFLVANLFDLGNDAFMTTGSVLSMAMIPAGFYGGYRLTEDKQYSSGRALTVTTAGITGALTGLFLPTLFEKELFGYHNALYSATTLAGHAAGTAFGFLYREDASYSLGQGVFHILSTAAGAAVGLGLPFIANADDHRLYVVGASIGAWGGLLSGERLSRKLFDRPRARVGDRAQIELPFLTEIPIALAGALAETNPETVFRARAVTIRF